MLTFRRSYPNHEDPYRRDEHWAALHGEVHIGSIILHRGRSGEPPTWRWAMQLHAGHLLNGIKPLDGAAPTREDAIAEFRSAWEMVRPAIGAEGWRLHVEHHAWLNEMASILSRD